MIVKMNTLVFKPLLLNEITVLNKKIKIRNRLKRKAALENEVIAPKMAIPIRGSIHNFLLKTINAAKKTTRERLANAPASFGLAKKPVLLSPEKSIP